MKIDWYAEDGEIVIQCENVEDMEKMEDIYHVILGLCKMNMD